MKAGRTVNSQSVRWCTPPKYIEPIIEILGNPIALDPCSDEHSIVPAENCYLLPEHDGLVETWNYPSIFVNPPYGADRDRGTTIKNWLKRCLTAHLEFNSEVLALIPVAANTKHWKQSIWGQAAGICFLYDTRLKFLVDGKLEGKGAPMACAMVYWGAFADKFVDVFLPFGAAIDIRQLHSLEIGNAKRDQQKLFTDA